jgi:hypothetical protein
MEPQKKVFKEKEAKKAQLSHVEVICTHILAHTHTYTHT